MGNITGTILNTLITLDGAISNTGSKWSLSKFFESAKTTVQTLGSSLLMVLGVIMIVVAGIKIGKGLMGGQNSQPPNWIMTIILLIVGGAFAVGGIGLLAKIAGGGQQTIEDLGNDTTGSIIMTVDEPDYFSGFTQVIQIDE